MIAPTPATIAPTKSMMKKNDSIRMAIMTSNRQPKNRVLSYEQMLKELPSLIADAENRLEANTLPFHVSLSRKHGKIQDCSSVNVQPPESCWLRWLGNCPDDWVCLHCYGCGAQRTYRETMTKVLVDNMVLLKSEVKPELIPIVMGPVRWFAFGECHNLNMAKWSLAFAKKNRRHSQQVVFTKNYHLYEHFKHIPSNTTIIGSNYRINDVRPILKANVHKTFAAVTTIEPYLEDNKYYFCHDKCINCYLKHEGCFSRDGPTVIVRLLQ